MPRTCTVCAHSERAAVDEALVNGESFRNIAEHFALSVGALKRHKDAHLPARLSKAREAVDVASADALLEQVRDLQARSLTILATAEKAGDLRTALAAIGQARANLELLAKLVGQLQEGTTVNVHLSPEWVSLRTLIVQVLGPYPEARQAIAEALRDSAL